MKLFFTLFTFLFLGSTHIIAQKQTGDFVTQWEVIGATSIMYPGIGNNYTIYWESDEDTTVNGLITNASSGEMVSFPSAGKFNVYARSGNGSLIGIDSYNYSDSASRLHLKFVVSWGNTHWTSLTDAFNGMNHLDVIATDTPDLSGVISLNKMFYACGNLIGNSSFNSWNTSTIIDMSYVFSNATSFNQLLDKWDMSKVIITQLMFRNASSYNQPLDAWDVSNVLDMSAMFQDAVSFNMPLNNWNTSKLLITGSMFDGAILFNQPLNNWDVSNVVDMHAMFRSAIEFDQPIENWNTAKVLNMNQMFYNAIKFNQPMNNFNVSGAVALNSMFYNALEFNQLLGKWKLRQGVSMTDILSYSGMNCANYSSSLKGWANNSSTPSNVDFGAQLISYGTAGETARQNLIDTKGWNITGDIFSMSCRRYPLGVQLLSFSGAIQQGAFILNWATTAEINLEGFIMEHSANGRDFTSIGFVKATGTNAYTFTDKNPLSGGNYYRLKIVSKEGDAEYSNIVFLKNIATLTNIRVSPNPVRGVMHIRTQDISKIRSVQLYSSMGKLVFQQVGKINSEISVQQLAGGIYLLKVILTDGSMQTLSIKIESY